MMGKSGVTFAVTGYILFLFCMDGWGADWKYFGASVLSKGEEVMTFYDAESIEYLSTGNVRVWTKVVNASEHNKKIMEKEEVIEKAARKIAKGYYPPYVLVDSSRQTSLKDCISIIGWEEGANDAEIKPRARIFFEVSCWNKMIRSLSSTFYNDAGVTSSSKGGEWEYIGPETNSETLRKILCKDKK